MARKTQQFVVQAQGRDYGKVFVITEMPARQAEEWAIRAFLALAQSGVEIPDNMAEAGFAGLFQMGTSALAKVPFDQAQPLLAEMFDCIQIMPSRDNPSVVRALVETDIEEIATRIRLRAEVLKLHSGFSSADGTSTSA